MSIVAEQTKPPWAPYEPNDAAPWNLARVVHLHRRAGFAASWPSLQRDLADGPHSAIDRLLNGRAGDDQIDDEFETLARTIGDAATASGSPGRLKAWWLFRMLLSRDPLRERLALVWHNHFATSNRKVQDLVKMREQNELFRELALAPFGVLLEVVVKQPAMLVWLDAESNRKGHPNENLARELMELFTLGIGNYTEQDIKESARALTGWTIVGNRFEFREARHDEGQKQLLGVEGSFDGDDLLARLLAHPATARRLAWRICDTFMGDGVVDDDALDELANGLTAHQLDIDWAVETVLRSQRFFAEENMRSCVASPAQYVIGTLRALEFTSPPPSTLLLAEWMERMGQDLFYPPNVGGWNEGRAWLASRTIVARANFAGAVAEGRIWHPAREPDFRAVVKRHGGGSDVDEGVAWFSKLFWGDVDASTVKEVVTAVVSQKKEDQLAAAVALMLTRPENSLA